MFKLSPSSRNIFTLSFLFCIASCNYNRQNETTEKEIAEPAAEMAKEMLHVKRFEWLLGTWTIITPQGQLYEVWTKDNDSLFTGNTCMIINDDTSFTEVILLKMVGEDCFYIPTIKGQNDDKPVPFKLISDKDGEFIFENNQHDFPQRIIYHNSQPDSLHARIEGNYKGEFRREEFAMGRQKD